MLFLSAVVVIFSGVLPFTLATPTQNAASTTTCNEESSTPIVDMDVEYEQVDDVYETFPPRGTPLMPLDEDVDQNTSCMSRMLRINQIIEDALRTSGPITEEELAGIERSIKSCIGDLGRTRRMSR
jgi:hypothetical protein